MKRAPIKAEHVAWAAPALAQLQSRVTYLLIDDVAQVIADAEHRALRKGWEQGFIFAYEDRSGVAPDGELVDHHNPYPEFDE